MPTGEERVHGAAGDGSAPRKAVFLSHSSGDAELAQRICARLELRGVACWIAPRDVTPGRPYAAECLAGVAQSASLVLLASEKALSSVQVLAEIEQAHKRAHPIYTVLIPPAKVQGEVDFYLSRLHWLQSAGRTAEELADTIASAIQRPESWEETSSPPSLRRTMRYRPVAFAKLMGASVLSLLLLLGGVAFAVNRMLDQDFRRLGYVSLSAEPGADSTALVGHAQVWLMAKGVAFRDVQLKLAAVTSSGAAQPLNAGAWPIPEQVGDMQGIAVPLAAGVRHLTTCLIVPSPGLHGLYRVTQQFTVAAGSEGIQVAEVAEKSVSKEDGSPCGAKPR